MGIHERKEREKEQRREEILNAAQKVFFEKGLLNSTMDEIAEQAELSKGTLYLYNNSKEDLYLAVMMRGMDVMYDMFQKTIQTSSSTIEAIWGLGTTYFEFFEKDRNFFRMLHYFQNPTFHKQVSEEMREACYSRDKDLWKIVTDVFDRGIAEHVLRDDLSPLESSMIIWSSAHAILLRIDSDSEAWHRRFNINLRHLYFRSISLFLQAIMTDDSKKQYAFLFNENNIAQLA